jgi:hypothetical protein
LWQRRSAQLDKIEFLDSGHYSATKEAVRFEVCKVIAVQGRNPLLLSASTARAWRHTRARVDRVAAPTYPDPATKAWLLASIASWRSQRSLQPRRRWHRSPATAHRTFPRSRRHALAVVRGSQAAGTARRHRTFRLAIPRSGDSAPVEHARVSRPIYVQALFARRQAGRAAVL